MLNINTSLWQLVLQLTFLGNVHATMGAGARIQNHCRLGRRKSCGGAGRKACCGSQGLHLASCCNALGVAQMPQPLYQVRETKVVCKGWSDSLSWLEVSDGAAASSDELRQVLMSVHSRLEGINAPFIQVTTWLCRSDACAVPVVRAY